MSESAKGEYRTTDLALAATLGMLGVFVIRIDPEDEYRKAFVFGDSDALRELVKNYYNNELKVEPRRFFDQIKSLKSRIYSNG